MYLDDAERWVIVAGFPTYEVSNYGRILNAKTERLLTPRCIDGSKPKVALYRDGKPHEQYVHIIVAKAFFRDYREGLRVVQVNDDKFNNSIWNLRVIAGNPKTPRAEGPRWGRRVRIVETGRTYRTVIDCARNIGGDYSTIYACLRGERKSHLGYTFEYVEE